MGENQLKVSIVGMTCTGCSGRVQKLLERHHHVLKATVNHETGTADIQGSPSESDIRQIIEHAGYEFKGILK